MSFRRALLGFALCALAPAAAWPVAARAEGGKLVEGGYEIPAGPIVLRPFLGLGLAQAHVSESGSVDGVSISGGGASTGGVFFAPGVVALYPVTSSIALGVDLRYVVFSANGGSADALSIFLTGQYHF